MLEPARKPDFFLVGAPKSGTTAMDAYLGRHPQIFIPPAKELHHFGSDLHFARGAVRDRDAYLSLFGGAGDALRVGESSVWYLYSREAAREIRAFQPEASILIMLRNPVDMLYSQHSQFLYNGNEDIADFAEALAAEDDRREGRRIPKDLILAQGLLYRDTARYAEQVERYLDVFGPERVHVIVFDDFVADTAGCYAEVLRFLGVDDAFRPSFEVVNPNKVVRSRSLRRLADAPSSRWRVLARTLLPARSLRRTVRSILERANTDHTKRSPLDGDLRCRLQAEFAGEVDRLGKLLGRDLSHWKSAE